MTGTTGFFNLKRPIKIFNPKPKWINNQMRCRQAPQAAIDGITLISMAWIWNVFLSMTVTPRTNFLSFSIPIWSIAIDRRRIIVSSVAITLTTWQKSSVKAIKDSIASTVGSLYAMLAHKIWGNYPKWTKRPTRFVTSVTTQFLMLSSSRRLRVILRVKFRCKKRSRLKLENLSRN